MSVSANVVGLRLWVVVSGLAGVDESLGRGGFAEAHADPFVVTAALLVHDVMPRLLVGLGGFADKELSRVQAALQDGVEFGGVDAELG